MTMGGSVLVRNCVVADARGVRDDVCDVVVHDGRIVEIVAAGSGRMPGDVDAPVVDVRGGSVVPGFVNMHAHLSFAHPRSTESAAIEGEGPLGRVLRMAGNARKAVGAGVTTMRLVGEFERYEMKVRDAIVGGHLEGPRIFTAGAPLTNSSGHGAFVGAVEADSPEGLRLLAEQAVANGVDLLKLMISSGIAGGNVETVRMTVDEFAAIREVARSAGLRMAVHTAAVEHPIIETLIDDGVDTLEHCYTAPDSIIDRCVDRSILLVLTPLVTQSEEYFREIQLAAEMVAEIMAESDRHWGVVRTAVAKGARLALGTDFQSHLQVGGTWAVVRELELYREAGVDPLGILALASRSGAEWLGIAEEVGLVEEGYIADLLVVDGNPVDDVSAFRRLRLVVAEGRPHDVIPPQRAAEPAVAPA
jgi:imidazolonepropionase-like amidohydrolase